MQGDGFKLSEEEHDHYLRLDESAFEIFAKRLAPAERQAIKRSRFLLQKELGSLSTIKTVKSKQLLADELNHKLEKAKVDLVKREKHASEALTAAFNQSQLVKKLEAELEDAIQKAKDEVEAAKIDKPAEPEVPPTVSELLRGHGDMAKQVADNLDGLDLGAAAAPLRLLLQSLAADAAKHSKEPQTQPAAAAPSAAAPAAEGQGGVAKPAGNDDVDMGELISDTVFSDAADSFCAGDPEKRKWIDEFHKSIQAQRSTRQRCG